MTERNNLDKTQRRNGSLESTRQLQIEPVHRISQNLLTDRQEVREPQEIFINKKAREKQTSVSVKKNKNKDRYRESKDTKDYKIKALSQKTSAAPRKEPATGSTTKRKAIDAASAVPNSASSGARRQRIPSHHTDEQQQVLDDIKKVNLNIENLYENIKNSDKKSSQRKLRTDPRVYGSAEARKLANEQYGNLKIRPMQTDDFEPEQILDTKTLDLLKNVKPNKGQGKYDQTEPKNPYGLAGSHQIYGVTAKVCESQQEPVLISTFEQQNSRFDQNTTTKKVQIANLKKQANNYTELSNPGMQYKIPQFQLTKNVDNFDEKTVCDEQPLRARNAHVYQNQLQSDVGASEPNFVTTVRSAASGDKSRTSSGIGYKTNQNSGSGANGRRRLIFQREATDTKEKESPEKAEKFHKVYLNKNNKQHISSQQQPKFLQRHARQAGQAQSSVHLPKNSANVASIQDITKQYGIVKRPLQTVSKSQDKNQKMLRQIIDQQKSKFVENFQSSQSLITHTALRSQQMGPSNTSGSKADVNNFHPLGSLEFVKFIEKRDNGSEDSQHRKDGQIFRQEVASNQTGNRGVVSMRKISNKIIQGQKPSGRQIKQILQNTNMTSATKRTNLRANINNQDNFVRFKGVTKVQAPTQILQSTNLNDNVTYYSGHQSITLKALQQKQGSVYDTNPSQRQFQSNTQKREKNIIETRVESIQALHEVKEQRLVHKQKLDDRKSQRSVNNQMSRFKSQPSIGNIQQRSGSIKSQKQIKPIAQSTQDEILIQNMQPENFDLYHGYRQLSQPNTNNIVYQQTKQQLSQQTCRTKSVRQISEEPQSQRLESENRFKNKGRRHRRLDSGGSNYEKGELPANRRSRDQKLTKRATQRSSVGHINLEDERLAQSSGMGVIAESNKDLLLPPQKITSNQQKVMLKQKSHVVLSPLLFNKEQNVKQESHLLYMNPKETIEPAPKNINSIQLRSARNLPEIKALNSKREQNYNIVKVLKVTDNKEDKSPARLKNQKGLAKAQAQNLQILQSRASLEKNQMKTSRAVDNKSIRMPKQLANKHTTSTTPATPIGGVGPMNINHALVAEKQKLIGQQKFIRKNKESKTGLQAQEARLDKLIQENNQILKKKPYENVKSKQQFQNGSSSTETEKRQQNGCCPYRNQARKLTRPAAGDGGMATEREFQNCSGTSLRKTTKAFNPMANDDAETVPRQKNDDEFNEYKNIMKSDESVVFYKNEEKPPQNTNMVKSPEQKLFGNNAERLSQLSSIKKNSSQKKGDLNLTKSMSPIAQTFKLNVNKFDLENMNPHEKPSIIFQSRGEQPAIMLEQFHNDLDIKGQQMSEIPKNTITNKDFDRIIDNLDEKFQLFSEQNSLSNQDNVIPKNVERLRDLRAKKQPFPIFASQEMTPIKKDNDNMGQIEDLEALCDGLDGIVIDSARVRNKQFQIQLSTQKSNQKPVNTVPDEQQDIKFLDQQNSLTYSQQLALNGIDYHQRLETQNNAITSPRIPASESSVNLLLKLQQKKKQSSQQKSRQQPEQQDINPLSFYTKEQKNENDYNKVLEKVEIIQVRPSAEKVKMDKVILQKEFELKKAQQKQYVDINRNLKTVLEPTEQQKDKSRSNMMSIEVPNLPPGAGDLMSPSCKDLSAAESNNKQGLFLMSIQRSQTSNMFNEVENFFPPADLCFGLDDNSYLNENMENYNRQIDQIQLIQDTSQNMK